jgi:hypothetical protein
MKKKGMDASGRELLRLERLRKRLEAMPHASGSHCYRRVGASWIDLSNGSEATRKPTGRRK